MKPAGTLSVLITVATMLLALPSVTAQSNPISYQPLAPDTKTDVQFSAQVTGTFTWDFGDGSPTMTGATAVHRYQYSGVYHVTITQGTQTHTREVRVRIPQEFYTLPPDESPSDSPSPSPSAGSNNTTTLETTDESGGGGLTSNPDLFAWIVIAGAGGVAGLGAAGFKLKQKRDSMKPARKDEDEHASSTPPPPSDLPPGEFGTSELPAENLDDLIPAPAEAAPEDPVAAPAAPEQIVTEPLPDVVPPTEAHHAPHPSEETVGEPTLDTSELLSDLKQ